MTRRYASTELRTGESRMAASGLMLEGVAAKLYAGSDKSGSG
jgi:hypothetical protein